MVYDSHRGKLVVIGGIRYTSESAGPHVDPNVYEWDEFGWRKIPGSSRPGVAATGAAAYDSKRNVTVFVGGQDVFGQSRTMEWNGRTWEEIVIPGRPSARYSHSMSYDESRGVTVLFGGIARNGSMLGDTWEYDGESWRRVSVSGPIARFDAAMTYDFNRGVTTLHGGLRGIYYGAESDLWEWDGQLWTRITPTSSAPQRSGHTLVYEPTYAVLLAFGGGFNYFSADNETWVFADNRWLEREPPTSPPSRRWQAAAFDGRLGRIAIFGGDARSRRYSDLWWWEGHDWVPYEKAPPAYSGGATAFDPIRNELILHGGMISFDESVMPILQKDTWRFVDGQWEDLHLEIEPAGRYYASITWDDANGEIVLFGGQGRGHTQSVQWTTLRDTWTWNGRAWRQHSLSRSVPPAAGPIWFDSNLQKVVMASWRSNNPNSRAMWLWDGERWTETSIVLPVGTEYTDTIFFDQIRKVTVVREGTYNRTWLWDGSTWELVYSDGTPPRYRPVGIYDLLTGAMLLYGGTNEVGSLASATWWDGTSWHELGSQLPGDRIGASGAYDPQQGRGIVFGGYSYSYGGIRWEFFDDTWSVRWVGK
jgi:hypothetical protein